MMQIKMKNPPLDETGGPREEEMEKSQSQQALQRKREQGLLESQLKGPNLIKILQAKASQYPKWFQKQNKPPTPDRAWNKTLSATHRSIQLWISDLAKQADSRSSFNELMDTLVDVSFINNDLEYLRGGASSCKYTTSVTKTKAADYGHIKWIEDLFYRFAANRESARDVYSKRRIIAVIELQIVKWHNYKHLDWITIRRDDDWLYKFKEGNFKRLRIQDIEDM
nr:hypothetical protein [Tanacetum cinerariifolium]